MSINLKYLKTHTEKNKGYEEQKYFVANTHIVRVYSLDLRSILCWIICEKNDGRKISRTHTSKEKERYWLFSYFIIDASQY